MKPKQGPGSIGCIIDAGSLAAFTHFKIYTVCICTMECQIRQSRCLITVLKKKKKVGGGGGLCTARGGGGGGGEQQQQNYPAFK